MVDELAGLKASLRTATELSREAVKQINSQAVELGRVDEKIQQITANVEQLSRVVHAGNGKAPLTERVALLESKAKSASSASVENTKGRWLLWAAVTSAGASIVMSIIDKL